MKYKYLIVSTIIVLCGMMIYSNSFQVPFHFDDKQSIVDNYQVNDIGTFAEIPTWLNIQNRTLSLFTFALNKTLFGDDVFFFHLGNLIIHGLCAFLCFLLTQLILKNLQYSENTSFWISLFCCLIVIAHPINTQAVTYIVQRMTLLSSLFYLVSIFFYLNARFRWIKKHLDGKVVLYAMASLFAGYLALISKQNAASLPIMMIMLELILIRKNGKMSSIAISMLGLFAFLTVFFAISILNIPTVETTAYSRSNYILTQSRVIFEYLRLIFVPTGLNLDHDFSISYQVFELKTLIAICSHLLIIALAAFLFQKKALLSIGVFWFYIALSIESSIIPIQDVMMEHRVYLSLIGLCWLMASMIEEFSIFKRRKISVTVAIMIVSFLSILSYKRNKVWRSEHSLWKDVVSKSPNKSRPNNNFGYVLFGLQKLDSAETYYKRAVKNNIIPEAHNNLGSIYLAQEKYSLASENIEMALKKRPNYAGAYNNLGLLQYSLGNLDSAIINFNKAIEFDPNFGRAFYNIGIAYENGNKSKLAISSYKKAIQIDPLDFDSYYNLGNHYATLNKLDHAYNHYEKAYEINPRSADLLNNIGTVFLLKKDSSKAKAMYQEALKIDNQHPSASINLNSIQ